jgi:ABC-2 type transport system ATP-binding protein
VIIHRGRFVEHATTAELSARAAGGVRVRSPQADRLRALLAEAGLTVTSADGDLLLVGDGSAERVGEIAAANGVVLHELAAEKSTLEEAFLELTAHETTE